LSFVQTFIKEYFFKFLKKVKMENGQIISMPRIGDKAPDFEATTTIGKIKFSEFIKGSWTIMFSHPADFTPVCTTEMSGFAKEKGFFNKYKTKLIGLSIDSIHSHLAWVNNVRKNTEVYMDFPIIADLDMKVAKLYGMLHPGESATAAVRAVFYIDPKGVIRLIMYYPLNMGRNMAEIQRALIALQTTDKYIVALPLNWEPGDKVIVPPPKTLKEMEAVIKNTEYEKVDFYLTKKELGNCWCNIMTV
jgi:peroxiredoxin (alkyl hydroperoxide reductase subunit C)